MSTYVLPPISKLHSLTPQQQKELLDHLFEHCEALHEFLVPRLFIPHNIYASYQALIEKLRLELLWFVSTETAKHKSNPSHEIDPRISRIIAAHPRLGASPKKVITLSEHSSKEQASLNAGTTPEQAARLQELNDEYERVFPGLRFVVFVNGRSRAEIIRVMEQRIARGDIDQERKEAMGAMCDIGLDRANKLGAKL